MKLRGILLSAAAALCVSGAGPVNDARAAEGEHWVEVKSEHFTVYTNVERERAEQLVRDLEKFRFTIGYLAGLDTASAPSVPVTVYAYDSLDDYQQRFRAYGTAGVYMSRAAGPVSILSLEDGEEDWELSGKRVLMHEYTHHILHQFSPIEYPRWYDEGFAEYVATMEFDGDHAVIGLPALHRAPLLKRTSQWLRSFEIIESRGRYLGHIGTKVMRDPRRGKGGMSLQYAQGWLMVHYLHSEPGRQRGIGKYLSLVNRPDVDDEKAFREAFGIGYKRFDRELLRYWRDAELATGRVEIASKMPPVELEVRELPPLEAAAIDHEARIASGTVKSYEKLAESMLRTCLENEIRPAEMRHNLIRLALVQKDWDTAEDLIDQALQNNPDDPVAMTLQVILERRRSDDELEAERARALRKIARDAILKDPTWVPALIQFADLTLEHELDIDHNVASVIDSIGFLAPDLGQGKRLKARFYAKTGQREEALAIVDGMIKWSASADEANALRKFRKELEAAMDS